MPDSTDRSPPELVRRYFEACNERSLDDFDSIFTQGFISHLRVGDIVGLASLKQMMRGVYDAFPDVAWTLIEEIYAPDRAIVRYYFEGTHVGPFLGIAPGHRRIHVDACEVLHLRDGWIHEVWNYADLMGLAAQMNAINPLALQVG